MNCQREAGQKPKADLRGESNLSATDRCVSGLKPVWGCCQTVWTCAPVCVAVRALAVAVAVAVACARARVCVYVRVCVRACVRARARVYVRVSVRVCVSP